MNQAAESSTAPVNDQARVARSTIIVMGGFALSVAFSLVRGRFIAGAFGTGSDYSAFVSANAVTELMVSILSGGALAFAFVPIYTEVLKKDRAEANRLFSDIFNLLMILTVLVAILCAIFAPILVTAPWGVAPSYSPEQQALTISLMRIMLITLVIFALSFYITGVLQAHNHFLLPALSPIFYTGGLIIGTLFAPQFGIYGLAWGAVAGSAVHLLIQLPGLFMRRIRWLPVLSLQSAELRRVAVLMLPRLIDLFLATITLQWLNSNVASGLGVEYVAALQHGYTLMNMPWTLIGVAIGTVIFPTLAHLAADQDLDAQRRALSGAARAVLTLAIPAAVGLIVLGRPIIQILLEGGEFTPESTELVYFALQFYALMMISQSMLNVVVPAFAAQKDTWTPLYVSLFTTALNIGLALGFAQTSLGHGGLPLARAIAVGLEVTIDLTILHYRWGGVDARRILIHLAKTIIAALGMAGAVMAIRTFLDPSPLILLALGGAVGIVIYFGLALLLGIQEVRTLPLTVINSLVRRRAATQIVINS